jgi:hypothetical protein
MSIVVQDGANVVFDHVIMEHGHFGLQLDGSDFQASITNSIFRYIWKCAICGSFLHPIKNKLVVTNSQFIDVRREAVDTYADQNIILRHNVFAGNYVAIMSVGSRIMIENNLFRENERGIGIVERGQPTIIANQFEFNQGPAIFAVNSAPIITGNNFIQNGLHISLEGSDAGLTAEENWWGTTDPNDIEPFIHDKMDNSTWGMVDLIPLAPHPFQLEVPNP